MNSSSINVIVINKNIVIRIYGNTTRSIKLTVSSAISSPLGYISSGRSELLYSRIVGVGYVGIITAACFADLGNKVVALDIDQEKIAGLKKGKMPIYESGLKDLIDRNVEANRIRFTTSYEEGLKDAEFVFIAVGTPSGVDGEADLQYVASAAR